MSASPSKNNRASVVWIAVVAVVAGAIGLASCTSKTRRTPDDTLVVVMNEPEITEIDPRYAVTSNDAKLSRLVTTGLVAADGATLPRLDLAERLEQPDALTWVATLRADVRFSDGSPVTAADVVYTFESMMAPGSKSMYRQQFAERLAAVEELDARTVRFRLKQPLATFRTDLDFGIVSRRAAQAQRHERWADGRVIGAGPYKIVTLETGKVTLERNAHFYAGPPLTRFLEIRTIRDANARLLVLVGGSADLTQNTVRADLLPDVLATPRLRAKTGPSNILTYLLFNQEDPILRDVRVRRAIAHAVDVPRIARAKFGEHAVLATGLLAPGHWAYRADVPRYALDLARARQLLDEAGYPDPDGDGPRPRFSLTWKASTDPLRLGVARAMKQDLARVGIDVEVRSFEFATVFADIKKGAYQLAVLQTSEILEPDMYYPYFHSSRVPHPDAPDLANRMRYRSAEADRLMEAGRREADLARRKAIYGELQGLMGRDLPVLPLWHEANIAVFNADVEGYEVSARASLYGLGRVTKKR
jgi:peptide/nickel transport system substrate-binding protein